MSIKIKKVRIENYRSVTKVDLQLDSQPTALVGSNEHGKTNLLWAIRLLDFETPIKESDKRTPRGTGDPKEPRIIFEFDLEDKVRKRILARSRTIAKNTEDANTDQDPEQAPKIKQEKIFEVPSTVKLEIAYGGGEKNHYSILDSRLADGVKKTILSYLKFVFQRKVVYFDTVKDRLDPVIPREKVTDTDNDNEENDVIRGLIKLAGLEGKEHTIFEGTVQARRLCRQGSRKLTSELKKRWLQGKEDQINFALNVKQDNCLCVEIEDPNTYGDVSTRSRGFLFFLSFVLKFVNYHDKKHDEKLEKFIFLIEEPETSLHPQGQKDLLSYLEELAKFNQVIYTTHSPFMINRLKFDRIRVIKKERRKGTQIDEKPYLRNWNPLRYSLGMRISDSFFFGDNCLIVEGPADRVYLSILIDLFRQKNVNKIAACDFDLLSIVSAGGHSNIPAMAQLLRSENVPTAVLVDAEKDALETQEKLLKKHNHDFKKEQIKSVQDFREGAITLEDVLPTQYLEWAINKWIKESTDKDKSSKPDIKFDIRSKGGIIKELKNHLVKHGVLEEGNKVPTLGIATCFSEVISEEFGETRERNNLPKEEFAASIKIIEWVAERLKDRVPTNHSFEKKDSNKKKGRIKNAK